MERSLVAVLAIVACGAFAQAPVSGLRGNAPAPRSAVTVSQQLVIPADFARLDDNAIIIIGGKPATAGEVKRIVRSLDDNAIIIIGGKPTAAGDVKRQLDAAGAQQKVDSRTASPSTLSPWPAPPAGSKGVPVQAAGKTTFGIHGVDPYRVHQNEKFVVNGIALGDKPGTVELGWYNPDLNTVTGDVGVTVMRWTSTRIDAAVGPTVPFYDSGSHQMLLIVTTANGEQYMRPMDVYFESKGSR